MKVTIEIVSHSEQRYDTAGDWFWAAPESAQHLVIRVSDTGHWRSNMLVALHELVEALLCYKDGIPQEAVDHFDMVVFPATDWAAKGFEPGDHPKCPYGPQHSFATGIERLMAVALYVEWSKHEERLDRL